MRLNDPRPIGVFDSGVGGLTVLKALLAHLPEESAVYLGDTARLPYGTKSAEVVTRYALKNAEFLKRCDIKLLVVACNTASAVALPRLQATLGLPVLGVIQPGASAAAGQTRSGRVGVIGTPGTVASGAYQAALERARPGTEVLARACPLFVPLAEEGWVTGDVPRLIAREYLGDLSRAGIDTLVLGCTHYPLLRAAIAEVMGSSVTLVDSAEATASATAQLLRENSARAPEGAATTRRYFVTDSVQRFSEVGARFLGEPLPSVEHVDISFD